jgi:peptidoglycan-N-acetylglucosamine deacetylase
VKALRFVAAFAALAIAQGASAQAQTSPQLAITMDDLPAHGPWPDSTDRVALATQIAAALKAGGAGPVYGFINHGILQKDPAVALFLDHWLKAGLPMGNHAWTHANLDAVGVPAFIEEIDRNEPYLSQAMVKRDWRWFRFPYLNEGADPAVRSAIRQELAKRGYKIAAVTMSFGDYLWNTAYPRCVATGDKAAVAEMERSFLAAATNAARASRSQARAVYGRDIPYVLLMHVGAFTTRMLPRLLAQYKREGFRFVSLPDAQRDPAYAADVNPSLPAVESLSRQASGKPGVYKSPDYGKALAAMCVSGKP